MSADTNHRRLGGKTMNDISSCSKRCPFTGKYIIFWRDQGQSSGIPPNFPKIILLGSSFVVQLVCHGNSSNKGSQVI
jgi:hypothetical protein